MVKIFLKVPPKSLKKWIAVFSTAIGLTLAAGQGIAAQKYRLGDIPLPQEVYKKYMKAWPLDMAEALSPYYDARDEGLVTSAKDQGQCGSCWAFASVGAMESHMLKAYQVGPEDLSEQQQVSCNTAMWGCNGGSSNAIRYWEPKGPLDESIFPYTASHTTSCLNPESPQLQYRVVDWHTVADNDFKNSVSTYGPSYWRYNVYSDFYDYWGTYSPGAVYVNSGGTYEGGHAVLLIGWDDSKGAYLCKNSWGETGGPNGDGTFWIAYSDHANDLGFGMANFSLISLGCSTSAECDDGVFCNGQETCVDGSCQEGISFSCTDDGVFCNGNEVCNEATQGCGSTGDPCDDNAVCNEDQGQCDSLCGNGVCGPGEDCSTCLDDCISGAIGGGDCSACFKEKCDGICHPVKEDSSCSDCAASYCCGDGICEGAEDSLNCAIDCPAAICGDGSCDPGEDKCNCSEDCGAPGQEMCSNGIDDDCDYDVDCDDADCADDASCISICLAKGESCQSGEDCCTGRCKNGKCR